jgi:hypothetical protein
MKSELIHWKIISILMISGKHAKSDVSEPATSSGTTCEPSGASKDLTMAQKKRYRRFAGKQAAKKEVNDDNEAFNTKLAEALATAIAQAGDTIMTHFSFPINVFGTEQGREKIKAGLDRKGKGREGNESDN